MKELLEFILARIIPPESFEVLESQENDSLKLVAKVDKSKIGLVIGKGGLVVKAIRNVLKIKATLAQVHLIFEVAER